MADLAPTAANVKLISGTKLQGISGVAILAGQWLYADAGDSSKLKLADNNDGTAAHAACVGMALSSAPGADQPVTYCPMQQGDVVDPGATVVKGMPYVLSKTAGAAHQVGDLATADNPITVILGVATETNRLAGCLFNSGAVIAADVA